jgi:hypothetical protein
MSVKTSPSALRQRTIRRLPSACLMVSGLISARRLRTLSKNDSMTLAWSALNLVKLVKTAIADPDALLNLMA